MPVSPLSGVFVISLDFELHWGGFEKWPLSTYKTYFDRTLESIPVVLSLFGQKGIHSTWATVGILLYNNFEEVRSGFPKLKPTYADRRLSAYHYIESTGIGESQQEDPYHYAGSVIDKILATPGQELGTHSFAHYYCNEPGQTVEQFRADIQAAKIATSQYIDHLDSLVFPRNQFNRHYLRACAEEGIGIVRSNPVDWWWQIDSTQAESKWKRLNRGLDAYFHIGGKTSYRLDQVSQIEGVYLLPASRLLRPYRPKEFFLNGKKISRIKSEMTRAAQTGEVYHLWWHPHNFGNYTQQNIDGLVEIIDHFDLLRKNHGMQSMSMGEVLNFLQIHRP